MRGLAGRRDEPRVGALDTLGQAGIAEQPPLGGISRQLRHENSSQGLSDSPADHPARYT
jgi:hypothetical protein